MAMAGSYEERPDVLAYRVQTQGSDIKELKNWRREVDGERSARTVVIGDLKDDMENLKGLVTKVIWSLVGLTLTIAGSSAALVLTLSGH